MISINILSEKERIGRLSRVRQVIFGTLDGLLVPLGVISAVAGGTGSSKVVIVAGIAEAFAGALSMGAGEFISRRAEAQIHAKEIRDELEGMLLYPDFEANEMALLLENEDMSSIDAAYIVEILQRNPRAYQKAMVAFELGLELQPETVKISSALAIALSYILSAMVPLISYFFLPVGQAFIASLFLSLLLFISIGVLRGQLARINLVVSILEVLGIGIVSGLGGYFLGTWIPKILGY